MLPWTLNWTDLLMVASQEAVVLSFYLELFFSDSCPFTLGLCNIPPHAKM